MSDKRDLTRIEDLSEFLHELENSEDEGTSFSEFQSESSDLADSGESIFESGTSMSEETPFDDSLNFESDSEFTTDSNLDSDFTTTFNSDVLSESDDSISLATDFPDDPFQSVDEDNPFESRIDALNSDAPPVKKEKIVSRDETQIAAPSPLPQTQDYQLPENFSDLKKFSEESSFSGMSVEGNPSFSVLIKDVRFIEDVNDIITLLKELELLSDTEEQIKSRLLRGTLLVSRISEYAAIYLAQKLRRFDIDLQVGLSDEIQTPKHQEAPETGIVSKFNLYQNQSHHFHFDDPKLELADIIIAATSSLEGHQVLRYMGVASEHKMLDAHIVEDENSDEVPHHYHELAQRLKAHALKSHANAVVGLNYQLTPIPTEYGVRGHKYRLTCTGNLVWVNKL